MMNNLHFISGTQELSMYKCTAPDQAIPIVTEPVLMLNDSSEELVRKSLQLQRTVGRNIYKFLIELYRIHGENPDGVKRYFTTQPVADMTRAELRNLGITEFFNICRDKLPWYKCEAYLDPIVQREQNTEILEKILEDIKVNIRAYLKDRVIYIDDRAIYIVDYQYDRYSAKEWPCLQKVAISYLGPKTEMMRFFIIERERFSNPIQASDSHQGTMVTPATKPRPPSSSKEDVTRQGGITIS